MSNVRPRERTTGMIRPSIQIAAGLLAIALALFGFWIGVTGLIDGQVSAATRFKHFTVQRDISPGWYWVDVFTWLAGGCGGMIIGILNIREARIAIRRKRAWRAHE
jgi:hypothetical protein